MNMQVRGLSKLYNQRDRTYGLRPISFTVEPGEMIAIVGHNGAGKSTLLKMLANWIRPDSGQMTLGGISLENRALLINQMGFVPEVPNLFEFFSIEYNFNLFASLFRLPRSRVEEILNELNLMDFRRHKVSTLSKGLKQRTSIGRALIANPPILLFDEPTSGLDFEMTQEIYGMLRKMHADRKTILFTSHRPEEIKSLATRIMVLHQGSLVFDGSPEKYFKSDTHTSLYTYL